MKKLAFMLRRGFAAGLLLAGASIGFAQADYERLPALSAFLSAANDANEASTIVGYALDEAAVLRPTIWQPEGVSVLPGVERGIAWSINNFGDIVGTSFDRDPRAAVLWTDTGVTYLPTLGEGSEALFIAEDGTIAGTVNKDGQQFACTWVNGALRVLINPLGGTATARGITADGRVLGTARYLAVGRFVPVTWDLEGTMTVLFVAPETEGSARFAFGNTIYGTLHEVGSYNSPYGSIPLNWDDTIITIMPFAGYGAFPLAARPDGRIAGYRLSEDGETYKPIIWGETEVIDLPTPEDRGGYVYGAGPSDLLVGAAIDPATNQPVASVWRNALFPPASVTQLPEVSGQSGSEVLLSATVRHNEGQPAVGRYVRFRVDGRVVATTRTNSDGLAQAFYTIPGDMAPGRYDLMASLGGSTYIKSVLDVSQVQTAMAVTDTRARRGTSTVIRARLTNAHNGSPLVNQRVEFVMDGVVIGSTTTDAQGNAIGRIFVRPRRHGAIPVQARYHGNPGHKACDHVGHIHVNG